VPQTLVDHYLVNLSELLTAALASPHFTTAAGGARVMDGFELGEIKPGSVIEQLGLKNGDVIQSVNGEKLDSLAAAIRLAAQAQNAAGGTMVVLRKGELLNFVFRTK
jgi:general secretion pathway protein C